MVDLFKDIDGGDALKAAKNGDLKLLLSRLRERCYLNDESIAWIADRLEGKKEGRQKTGGKLNKDMMMENLEMHELYLWLIDVEKLKPKEARFWLGKRYGYKDNTISKEIKKLENRKSDKLFCAAMGLEGDKEKFLSTKDNKYRPIPLRKIGMPLSKK